MAMRVRTSRVSDIGSTRWHVPVTSVWLSVAWWCPQQEAARTAVTRTGRCGWARSPTEGGRSGGVRAARAGAVLAVARGARAPVRTVGSVARLAGIGLDGNRGDLTGHGLPF